MDPREQKTCRLYVRGMHCAACELLASSELEEHPDIVSVRASLASMTVEIAGPIADRDPREIAAELTGRLAKHGYALSAEPPIPAASRRQEFLYAVPAAFAFLLLFVTLQKLGIVNLVDTANVTYGTTFLIGIVASLSSCMAVVGGLALSLSATYAKEGERTRPQILFHAGRLVSFFVLGGVIGALGAVFQIGIAGRSALGILAGLVMLALGLNLLELVPGFRGLPSFVPERLSKGVLGLRGSARGLLPFLVGAATFFLPCGFTQAMQVYALSTGSFLRGALTMATFALGTLPALALVSFGSAAVRDRRVSGAFFKAAGLVVCAFAVFTIANALVALGWIEPYLSF